MRTAMMTLATTLIAFNAYAKPRASQNPGLQWTINTLYIDGSVAAIQGDGAPYVNGQTGVDAVINVCSGTYDATLNLSGGRSLSFTFSEPVASNSYTPSWALAGATESGARVREHQRPLVCAVRIHESGRIHVHHLDGIQPPRNRVPRILDAESVA